MHACLFSDGQTSPDFFLKKRCHSVTMLYCSLLADYACSSRLSSLGYKYGIDKPHHVITRIDPALVTPAAGESIIKPRDATTPPDKSAAAAAAAAAAFAAYQ